MTRTAGLTGALLVAVPALLMAQVAAGNLYGTVTDQTGAVLPGVAVTLGSDAGTRATVSGTGGQFRFLGLSRSQYRLRLKLPGFTSLEREVRIVTGENVELNLRLIVSAREEVLSVVADTPLVDTKRRGTATTLTAEELGKIPTPRDPWGVLRNVPGVLTDRVNVAGNESGQQAGIVAKGSANTNWTLDGLAITDLRSGGASSSYYDFGAIDEIQVTTGGQDLGSPGGGLSIHLATKRGTNTLHGSARLFFAHDDLSSSNLPEELRDDPRLHGADKADHIQQIGEYGFDLGGPLLRDRLWFQASWGTQDIRLVGLTQLSDRTVIPAWNANVHWQATPGTQVAASYILANKRKYGRTGWGGVAADSYRWDQANASTEGGLPAGLWRVEVDHTVSPNLFLSARLAHHDNGFGLFARGDGDQSYTEDYDTGEAFGTYIDSVSLYPVTTIGLEGTGFFGALGGHHELKFGFGYRSASSSSLTSFHGNQLAGVIYGPGDTVAQLRRDMALRVAGHYWSAYAGDVYARGRLSVSFGLRWDGQGARNAGSEVPANRSFADLLPALSYAGNHEDIVSWRSLSPRIGTNLALDEGRRNVLRASYAEYAQQLPLFTVLDENPMLGSFLAYGWNDQNGDRRVQPGEVLLNSFLYSYNVDLSHPDEAGQPVSHVDRGLEPQRDREVIVGFDRELAPSLAVGIAYTWRRARLLTYYPWLAGPCMDAFTAASCPIIGPGSYVANPPVTANGYTAFTYTADPALIEAGGGGWLATTRPGYAQTYNGLELTLTRRLANHFMGRIASSWNDWVERFEGMPVGFPFGNPGSTRTSPLVEGGQVASAGKNGIFSSVKWQLYANGLVQLPWAVELSGAVFGRQGHPYPKSLHLPAGSEGQVDALAQPRVDVDRYPNVWDVDVRVARPIRVGRVTLTAGAELFNVFNSGVALRRNGDARSSAFDRIDEVLSPRVLRFGARLAF